MEAPASQSALGHLQELNRCLSNLVGWGDQSAHPSAETIAKIDLVRGLEITRDMVLVGRTDQQSDIHTAVNAVCKNRFLEKSKPELFRKVRELKAHWKEKMKEEEERELGGNKENGEEPGGPGGREELSGRGRSPRQEADGEGPLPHQRQEPGQRDREPDEGALQSGDQGETGGAQVQVRLQHPVRAGADHAHRER